MCIKIVEPEKSFEFNPMEPLENQVANAHEILVKYESCEERKINSFVREIERMVLSGISCKAEIKVNANNQIDGMKLERKLEKLKKSLDINELVKRVSTFHRDAECKLSELSEMCLGKIDER
jgi:hypothetical protein